MPLQVRRVALGRLRLSQILVIKTVHAERVVHELQDKCIRKSLLLKELLASCPALEFILIHLRFNGLFFI
jgi:hypothetical protein